MSSLARTPQPPYYAVIFTSKLVPPDPQSSADYGSTAGRMVELAQGMPGFLGVESARNREGVGITVCYWQTEADIASWKQHAEHRMAQDRGKREWYEHYELRIAKVERSYWGPAGR